MRRPARPGCVRIATAPLLVSLALTLLAGAAPSSPKPKSPGAGGAGGPEYVEGEVLVKLRADAAPAARRSLRADIAGAVQSRFASGAERWRLGPGVSVPEALARLKGSPDVEYAEPNYIVRTTRLPNDPLFALQHDLLNVGQGGGVEGADIEATRAWDISIGRPSIVVAVLDTGIDLDHPDLAANIWTNPGEIPGNEVDDDGNGQVDDVHGWDFVNHDNDPHDDMSHGTHVSGTIAAATDNGIGVAGVAWEARLMPVKFLDAYGAGNTADAIAAIDYATRNGARILNASWGGGGFSLAMQEAVRDAGAHEALFVAAAGNAGENNDLVPFFPAGYDAPNIIAVAATDRRDLLVRFSNRGATTVDIAAPGVDIMSTLPGGLYGFNSGTSMATPHVSGVAALILGFAPGMGAEPLRRRLIENAEPLAALAGQVASGGRLNADRCLQDADTLPPGPIADLRVVEPLSNGLVLAWTATGDDADAGAAVGYDLRISDEPFDAAGFEAAPRVPLPGAPLPAGQTETREIGDLEPSLTYHVGLRAVDEWGNAGPPGFASAATRPPPVMEVAPDSTAVALGSGDVATRVVTIRNAGEGTLDWSAARPLLRSGVSRAAVGTERWGGPDAFGYVYTDSDEPDGPVFAWRDITTSGRSALVAGDDVLSAPLPLGFDFPFYGRTFANVRIASNGFLSFTHPDAPFENQPLPSPGAPGNLVAGFWDDLFVYSLQNVLYLAEPRAFTVQYDTVLRYGGGGPYTFQIVLYDTGEVLFQYLSMAEPRDSATIGIQDATGVDGLPIAFNSAYLHDNMAIRLSVQKPWLSASPPSGRLRSGESAPLTLALDASGLAAGTYDALLPIIGNDPDRPRIEHPVSLAVEDAAAIAVEPAAVDFGRVFAGYGARLTVEILSNGSLPLSVSSAVPDDSAVVTDFAPFVLAAGERRLLNLDWRPASPGGLQAALVIASDAANAPALTLPLAGTAVGAPVLTVDPPEVEERVPSGGSSQRFVTLGNDGPTELDFQVTVAQPAGLTKGTIEIVPPSPQPLTCIVADPAAGMIYGQARRRTEFYRLRIADQTWETLPPSPLATGVNCGAALLRGKIYTASTDRLAVYDIALASWTTVPSPLGVATAHIASDGDRWIYLALGASVKRFDPTFTGLEESLPAPPFPFDRWGGLQMDRGILYGHSGNGATWFVRYDPFVGVWTSLPPLPLGGTAGAAIDPVSGDYFAAGPAGGSNLYRYDSKNSVWSLSPLPFPVEDGGLAWAGLPVGAIYFVEGERGGRIARLLLADARTAGVDTASGRIAPGGTAAIRLRFDAAGLPGGSYGSDLTIRSNDPASPERVVPVQLTVEGGASIRVRGEPAFLRSTLPYLTQGATTSHVLPLPSLPRSDGALRLVAEGDYGNVDEVARVSIDGIIIGSAGATGLDCSAAEGFFPLSASLLESFALDGVVSVSVANTGGVEAFCERSRHTVELSYRGAADRLDFGQRYLGYPVTLRLELENAGNGSLLISATTGAPEFIVAPGPLTLAPGERTLLAVEYRPVLEGASASTLVLATNDPAAPRIEIPLAGEAYRPSEGVVSPLSFSETLDRDLTVVRPLRIENHGGIPLSFSFLPRLVPGESCAPTEALLLQPAAGTLSRVDLVGGTSSRVAYVPPGLDAALAAAELGTVALAPHAAGLDGTLVRVDLATGHKEALGPSIPFPGGFAVSADLLYVSHPGTGRIFVMPVAGGSSTIALSGLNQPTELAVSADGNALYVVERGFGRLVRVPVQGGAPQVVAGGFEPFGGLVLDEPAGRALVSLPGAGDIAAVDLASGQVTTLVSDLGQPTSMVLLAPDDLLVADLASGRLTRLNLATGDRRTILDGIEGPAVLAPLPSRGCSRPFVSVEPSFGLVEPGALRTLAVTFDATGLGGGPYAADIDLLTNDPVTPRLTIRADLLVTGVPDWDIALGDPPATSEMVFAGIGATTSHSFPLPDPRPLAGEIELEVNGAFSFLSQYARAETLVGTAVSVGGTGVHCNPASLRRDLPDEVLDPVIGPSLDVSVQNSAATQAASCVNRHRVTLHLYRSADRLDLGGVLSTSVATRDLQVINRGAGLLTVSSVSSDNPAATVTPASFQVPGGSRRRVTLSFRAPVSGTDGGVIDLLSDDPDRPRWSIPWTLEARTAPVLSVDTTTIEAVLASHEVRTIPVVVTNPGGLDLHYGLSVEPVLNDWIAIAPASGIVPPGESRTNTLTLRPEGRAPGILSGVIHVTSNDPLQETAQVPVQMRILGTPHLFLESVSGTLTSTKTFYREGEEVEHAFAVAPGARNATITATVEGDFDTFLETSQVRLEGIALANVVEGGGVCGQRTHVMTVVPAQILQASADGVIRVTVKNSGAVQPHCPVNRQVLDMQLVSAPTVADFGSVRPGDTSTRTLAVVNTGSETLVILSTSTSGPFAVEPGFDTLLIPGERVNLPLRFQPTAAGDLTGALVIASTDPVTPTVMLALRGRGIAPPTARLEPGSFDLTLPLGVGTTRQATLFNDGPGFLTFRIGQRVPAVVAGSRPVRTDELPSSPVGLSGVVGDPATGIVYAMAYAGTRFFRLRPGGPAWEELPQVPIPATEGAGAALLNGRIYLAVGRDQIPVYDMVAETWSLLPLPPGLSIRVIASDAQRWLYLATGLTFVRLDPQNGESQPLSPFPFGMDGQGGMTHVNGRIFAHRALLPYAFGLYDPDADGWLILPSPPAAPLLGAAFDASTEEYLAYGPNSGDSIYRFSLQTGVWRIDRSFDHLVTVGGIAWLPGPTPGAIVVQGRGGTQATRFDASPPLLVITPESGTIPPGGSVSLTLQVNTGVRSAGVYHDRFVVESDDPVRPAIEARVVVTAQADRDGDGLPDLEDNCPDRANAGQEDRDADGFGDVCDVCADVHDPSQADEDADGIGDACDTCTDSDGDGFADTPSEGSTCQADNCPARANADQADSDGDGVGDVCDACDDPDHDGFADRDGPGRACVLDNCPGLSNPDQADRDFDSVGDACDPCPDDVRQDVDSDGLCADNCPFVANPAQEDRDGDGAGDACDVCADLGDPAQSDRDGDRVGDLCDDCPLLADPAQDDTDGDGAGDACDNCPTAANPGQEDAGADGSGDACQPSIGIDRVIEDGGEVLEVAARIEDPQGDALTGRLALFAQGAVVDLANVAGSLSCDLGWRLAGNPGEGIGYYHEEGGLVALFDLDSGLGCSDGAPDYEMIAGTCAEPLGAPDYLFELPGRSLPATVCIRPTRPGAPAAEMNVRSWDELAAHLFTGSDALVRATPQSSPLPRRIAINDLAIGSIYRLEVDATDGNTRPVKASASFHYGGEAWLTINVAPRAAANWPPGSLECAGPAGSEVILDATPSQDDDSPPGGPSDIVLYEWFEIGGAGGSGGSGETLLGTGDRLVATLAPGTHPIVLQVTDHLGATDRIEGAIVVADTRPPTLTVTASPAVLWPANHRLVPVSVTWQATDACSGAAPVLLTEVSSSEPDDAPGSGDGRTTGDIADALVGTADTSVLLRAERAINGPGRSYTLRYTATDSAGNAAQVEAVVRVPGGDRKTIARKR